MVVGYGTAALSVTLGTILLLLGLQLVVIGFLFSPSDVPPERKSLFPNGTVTFHDLQVTSLPLVGVGITATIFGYMLWFVHSKHNSTTKSNS